MKKAIGLCFFLCLLSVLFPEGGRIEWKVIQNTYSIQRNKSESRFFIKGETVYSSSGIIYSSDGYVVPVFADDDIYYLKSDLVIPQSTTDVFDIQMLSRDVPDRMYWMRDYFVDILRSGMRDTAMIYEKNSLSEREENYNEFDGHWYEHPNNPVHNCIDLSNVLISIYGISGQASKYFIRNIEQVCDGYNVSAVCYFWMVDDTLIDENQIPQKDSDVLLLLRLDGDYLDIYLNNEGNRIGSFVLVDTEFYKQCENQVYKNTSDLSKITWPRRDYDTTLIGSTCKTTDNLRLRSMQERKSNAIMTLAKGTAVNLLEIGRKETVDGIIANWVKVRLNDGTEGWCFGGYLDPRP